MQPLEVDVQPIECQESMRVRRNVHLQIPDDFGRDPARTQFQARKSLFVEHQHIDAAQLQKPRGRRPGGPAADYQDITRAHWASREAAYRA